MLDIWLTQSQLSKSSTRSERSIASSGTHIVMNWGRASWTGLFVRYVGIPRVHRESLTTG